MLDQKIEQAVNKQINREMAAAYNYLAMTAHFEKLNLKGFAHWTRTQRQEELDHANRLFTYLLDRGGTICLEAIPEPKTGYQTVEEVFHAALEQEQQNTREINTLYQIAGQENDIATQSMLKWFIDEQGEEEKIVDESLALVRLAGEDMSALFVLNGQFGQRTAEGE